MLSGYALIKGNLSRFVSNNPFLLNSVLGLVGANWFSLSSKRGFSPRHVYRGGISHA